jgi:hypothetical protein
MARSLVATFVAAVVFVVMSRDASAQQQPWLTQQAPETMNLSGPRFGVTFLSSGVRSSLGERGVDIGVAISQFGWQKEKRFPAVRPAGPA